MVLDHVGQNFNNNEEQKMQFENMLRDGLSDSLSKPDIKKVMTEVRDELDSNRKYIPQSKMKVNVKPSLPEKLLHKNNDSSYI